MTIIEIEAYRNRQQSLFRIIFIYFFDTDHISSAYYLRQVVSLDKLFYKVIPRIASTQSVHFTQLTLGTRYGFSSLRISLDLVFIYLLGISLISLMNVFCKCGHLSRKVFTQNTICARCRCHEQIFVKQSYTNSKIIHCDWLKKSCDLEQPIRMLYFSIEQQCYLI